MTVFLKKENNAYVKKRSGSLLSTKSDVCTISYLSKTRCLGKINKRCDGNLTKTSYQDTPLKPLTKGNFHYKLAQKDFLDQN